MDNLASLRYANRCNLQPEHGIVRIMIEQKRDSGREHGRFPSAGNRNTSVRLTRETIAAGDPSRASQWAVRAAFFFVFVVNVQCAVSFILWPASFAPAYELSGVAGEAAVRGMGIAFLMWNATYPASFASPWRFRVVAIIVVVQQCIGLVGESVLLAGLPAGHEVLVSGIRAFIMFDALGLVVMSAALVAMFVSARRSLRASGRGERRGRRA